jgi:hypothetical protein
VPTKIVLKVVFLECNSALKQHGINRFAACMSLKLTPLKNHSFLLVYCCTVHSEQYVTKCCIFLQILLDFLYKERVSTKYRVGTALVGPSFTRENKLLIFLVYRGRAYCFRLQNAAPSIFRLLHC